MRLLEIPETTDDLRFAAEAISKIASDAIKAISDLYSKAPSQHSQQFPQAPKPLEYKQEFEDPRFQSALSAPTLQTSKVQNPPKIPNLGNPNREILVDQTLNNLSF